LLRFVVESVEYKVTVTYMEIYNEIVYDLLGPTSDSRTMQPEKSKAELYEEDYDQLT